MIGLHLPERGEHGGIVVLASLHTALLSAVPRNEKSRPPEGNRLVPVEFGWKTKKCHLPTGQMTLCYDETVFSFRQTPKLRVYYSKDEKQGQGEVNCKKQLCLTARSGSGLRLSFLKTGF